MSTQFSHDGKGVRWSSLKPREMARCSGPSMTQLITSGHVCRKEIIMVVTANFRLYSAILND